MTTESRLISEADLITAGFDSVADDWAASRAIRPQDTTRAAASAIGIDPSDDNLGVSPGGGILTDNGTVKAWFGEIETNLVSVGNTVNGAVTTALNGKLPIPTGDITQYVKGDGNLNTLTNLKTLINLNNVDNTSDLNKPISTAAAAAIATKFTIPTGDVTQYLKGDGTLNTLINLKTLINLDQVDNTSDVDKPASAAMLAAVATATTQANAAIAATGATGAPYPNSAVTYLPQGVAAFSLTSGGTGGTINLTNVLCTYTGGTLTYNPTIRFDTNGSGVVTNVRLISPGLYIGTGSPTMPTVTFPGGAGSPAIVLTAGVIVPSGSTYWALSSDGSQLLQYGNNAGTIATAPFGGTQNVMYTKSGVDSSRQRASNMVPKLLLSELTAATAMQSGDPAIVTADPGSRSAVAGEIALGGAAATVGASIPNNGKYTYNGSAWLRTGDTEEQLAAAQVAILATTYTLRLDETGNGFQYSASPARYGYGTHRDLTEIAAGKLVGRIVVGLRPSAEASAKLDVYERLKTVANANTTAPGQHVSDVLVGTATLTWAATGAATGANSQVSFTLDTPFVRRDGYTYGFDPRFIDGSGVAIVTGAASISGSHADRTALFFRTGTPNTWSNSGSLTMAVKAYEATTAIQRDPAFEEDERLREVLEARIDAIDASLTGWVIPTYQAENTGAYYTTGTGALVSNVNYNSVRYDITGNEAALRFTASIGGNSTGLICYSSVGTYLGVRYQGSNSGPPVPYPDEVIDISDLPSGTTRIAMSGLATGLPVKIEIETARDDVADELASLRDDVTALQTGGSVSRYSGATALWDGTSIPEGFGGYGAYPGIVGATLGMTVTNKAISSSSMRRGIKSREGVHAGDTYGWYGWTWQAAFYCQMGTIAEKTDLITNYDSKWKAYWTGQAGLPASLDAPTQAAILASSYENVLATSYDYYFIDHGHNDSDFNLGSDAAKIAEMLDDTSTGPGETRDRGLYLGATMAYIDEIRARNSDAEIFLIGHYEKARKPWIYQSQNKLADLTDLPICRLWEKLGWTQQVITGGADAGKTMTQASMLDNVHPGSDPTGKAPRKIAGRLVAWLGTV